MTGSVKAGCYLIKVITPLLHVVRHCLQPDTSSPLLLLFSYFVSSLSLLSSIPLPLVFLFSPSPLLPAFQFYTSLLSPFIYSSHLFFFPLPSFPPTIKLHSILINVEVTKNNKVHFKKVLQATRVNGPHTQSEGRHLISHLLHLSLRSKINMFILLITIV